MADPRPTDRIPTEQHAQPQYAPRDDVRGAVDDGRQYLDRDAEIDGEDMRFRTELWSTQILPPTPEISGYHTIWLSTTNAYDSIARRLRQGYVLVKPEELPQSADYDTVRDGKFAGCVSCAEFVLAKIPTALYVRIMEHLHHDEPLKGEQAIKRRIEGLMEGGAVRTEGDDRQDRGAFQNYGRAKGRPRFEMN